MQKQIKMKHNKKRNTAFLFEALVKELTKAVVYGKKQEQRVISSIIKEHFNKSSILEKELKLYKQLCETKEFPREHAEKLVNRIKDEYEKLDEQEIFNEQSKLIAKINKTVGVQVYDNFVPNYKTLATVSQIFNRSVPQTQKIILEQEMVGALTSKLIVEKKELEPIDKITFKVAIDKFNKHYNERILPEQKELLSRFINFSDDDVELKIYLSEELSRIKDEIKKIKSNDIIKESYDLKDQVEELRIMVEEIKFDKVTADVVEKVLKIYEFLNEVNS
jgi:hypothetical protein